jgi:O-antigen ligase
MFSLCAVVIVASVVLGGAYGGFLSDAILQLIAIPLLFVSLWRLLEVPLTRQIGVALFFCAAIVAIPLIQLIPLPPWLWTALPGRQPVVEVSEILGHKLSWMPISLSPNETWLCALSLIAPLAIFLATLLLPYRERRWLSLAFLAVGVLSVFVGLMQVAQGPESPLRFYAPDTNLSEAVGFFAGRNHFAALLYALIMFAAAWTIHAATEVGERHHRNRYDTVAIVGMIGAFTLLVVLLAGEAIARSRMGLGFTMVALFGAFALGIQDRRSGVTFAPTRLIVGACTLTLIFSLQFGLYRIMERFAQDPLQDGRIRFARNTIESAIAYMPFGSGLGTSQPVYAMFEKPKAALLDKVMNHHNDFLELWLSTGAVGLVLTGMFMVWLLLRSVEIWRKEPAPGASALDWTLARGATVTVTLLTTQSLLDSPLRVDGTMAIMAFACAFLIEPPLGAQFRARHELPAARKQTRLPHMRKLALAAPAATPRPSSVPTEPRPSNVASLPSDRRWGRDVDWPEEWSKSSTPSSASGHDKPPDGPKPAKGP